MNWIFFCCILIFCCTFQVHSQCTNSAATGIESFQKISTTSGFFTGVMVADEHFGSAVVHIGDLNADNFNDLVV